MRLHKDRKGQVRVIEAFFASMLLLSVLTLVPTQSNVRNSSEPNLSSTARQVLLTLDGNGHLSKLIGNGSWTQIRLCLLSAFPPTVWFNLTVFDENNTVLNDSPITSGNSINQETYSFDYICVSQSPTYVIYLIRLQLAVVN